MSPIPNFPNASTLTCSGRPLWQLEQPLRRTPQAANEDWHPWRREGRPVRGTLWRFLGEEERVQNESRGVDRDIVQGIVEAFVGAKARRSS